MLSCSDQRGIYSTLELQLESEASTQKRLPRGSQMPGPMTYILPFFLFVPAVLCFVLAMRFRALDAIMTAILFNAAAMIYWLSIPVGEAWGKMGARLIWMFITATTIASILLGLLVSLVLGYIRRRRGM